MPKLSVGCAIKHMPTLQSINTRRESRYSLYYCIHYIYFYFFFLGNFFHVFLFVSCPRVQNEDDGLTSSPEFQEPSLSPSPSPTSTPPLSPQLPLITPHQPPLPPQHVSTVSGRPRPLLRMRTYGSIILPPTSSVKSKMGAHQPLLEVQGVRRSGSLSPLSWFDPPTSPSHKSGHLAVVGRCRSQSPVADHSNGSVDSDDSLDNGKITGNDSSDDLVTERQLQLLAPKIGSKLQLVTSLLGLHESDYTGIKVPEFQALCVLKKWFVNKERKVGELCHVLEKAELPRLAEW